ncbi:MAG: histone deacetylase [bacterium]|nr:histone deacetylase [bacterium]
MDVGFVYHPDYLKHFAGQQHPERPDRLKIVVQYLQDSGVAQQLIALEGEHDAQAWVAKVHELEHIQLVQTASLRGGAALDPDTIVCQDSFDVALKAVAGILTAADAVIQNRVSQVFCAVRPPGHHATPQRAMGFCLFNNVAVLARYLQQQHGLDNILIVDWDVHHGNGTQFIFEDDPSVLYFSIHQYPYYPGTGAATETGQGQGQGYTFNIPMAAGAGDEKYIAAFEQQFLPRALNYKPDCVLVSAGFDAHYADPLAQMQVTEEGYRRLTRVVKEIAARCCEHRLISVLEGGYHLEALGRSVQAHVEELQRY